MSTKYLDYKLVSGGSSATLSEAVREYLNKGWILYGHSFISPNGMTVYQAVALSDTAKPERVWPR